MKKNKKENNLTPEEAAYEVIHNYCEDIDLKIFDLAIKHFRKLGFFSEKELELLEKDFTEYMMVQREIFEKEKGEFRQKIVFDALPNNQWAYLLEGIFKNLKAKNLLKVKGFTQEQKIIFQKDVEKKIKGLDVH
ncbi:MAG: hypothetical protein V1892_00290 [bacterium]